MKYILIPVKKLTGAKKRLAGLMTTAERTVFATMMLKRLCSEVASARGYDRVVLISGCKSAAQIGANYGFDLIWEPNQISESVSVDNGSRTVKTQGATSVLRLPLDLPLIRATDIERILRSNQEQPAAVIVPSRDEMGTNAIMRTPPDLFPSQFGVNSLTKHQAEARRAGAGCEMIYLPRIALDIDEPADVACFLQHDSRDPIHEFLVGLHLQKRSAFPGPSKGRKDAQVERKSVPENIMAC
jgi:2-phospho-L-lactate guanylyltransferase